MSAYTECSLHGYYDNDNGCPDCQDAEETRIRLQDRARILEALGALECGIQRDGQLWLPYGAIIHAVDPLNL